MQTRTSIAALISVIAVLATGAPMVHAEETVTQPIASAEPVPSTSPDPTSSPAPTPTPSASPTDEASPSPSPTVEPTEEPTPTESASPSPTPTALEPTEEPLSCDTPVASVDASTRITGEVVSVNGDDSESLRVVDWQAPERADSASNWMTDDSSVSESPCEVLDTVAEDATDVDVVVVSYENGKPAIDVVTAEDKSEALAVVAEEQDQPETISVSVDTPVSVNLNSWNDPRNGTEWLTSTSLTPYWLNAAPNTDPQRATQNTQRDMHVGWVDAQWRGIEYVWKYGRGDGITVAVVDTGVDGTHEDLSGQVLPGYDFVSGATGLQAGWADGNSHGTHVAGIIAAKDNNGVGITGLAPDVQILPVRVLGDDGSGSSSTVAQGIIAATDAGADIINLSLGSAYPDPALQTAVEYALAHNVVLVAAGGNLNMPGFITLNGENYPASYDGVLGVASQDTACGGIGGNHIDITAYGCQILSTIPGNGYAQYSGTSMATPQVSAEVALLMSAGATGSQAVSTLRQRPDNTRYNSFYIYLNDADCPYEMAPDDLSGCVDYPKTRKMFGDGRIQIGDAMRSLVSISAYTDFDYWTVPGSSPAAPIADSPAETPSTGGSTGGSSGGGGGSSSGSSDGSGGGGSTHDIREVRPALGPNTGGNQISLIGFGMTTATEVKIGGKPAPFRVVNDAHIEVTVPASDVLGSADVFVNLGPAVGSILAPGGYTYVYAPPVKEEPAAVVTDVPPSTSPGEVIINTVGEAPAVRLWTKKAILTTNVGADSAGSTVKVFQKADGGKWKRVKKSKVKANGTIRVKVKRLSVDSVVRVQVDDIKLPIISIDKR